MPGSSSRESGGAAERNRNGAFAKSGGSEAAAGPPPAAAAGGTATEGPDTRAAGTGGDTPRSVTIRTESGMARNRNNNHAPGTRFTSAPILSRREETKVRRMNRGEDQSKMVQAIPYTSVRGIIKYAP